MLIEMQQLGSNNDHIDDDPHKPSNVVDDDPGPGPSPEDCLLSDWHEWSECSSPCGQPAC